ncbi:NUDIX hydrolase [Halobacillus massiliensis]|uniref:NUDIX hydrolase n=1 Tax=Halobacillus massiliensis TaxID=1926286 RepID=UPI0009E3A7C7|nr:NUDIX hydrolase [Halobacillus massiliensis]
MKKISAGLILTDGEYFLGCHSTGNWFYDLPKGGINKNERPIDACIRETKEETNLDIEKEELVDLGVFSYNPRKDLHLFAKFMCDLPSTELMSCSTEFIHYYTKEKTPEVDGYKYIRFCEAGEFMTKNMQKVIIKAKEKTRH